MMVFLLLDSTVSEGYGARYRDGSLIRDVVFLQTSTARWHDQYR
jgi:hypothetical protein